MDTTPRLRRPTRADLPAVGSLFRARDLARVGVEEVTDAELAHDWATPGFTLERDAWLVEDEAGTPTAYADLFPDEPGSVFVETVTANGSEQLEPWLLELVEARAAELGERGASVALRAPIVRGETERIRRYEAAGYQRVRTFFRMRLDGDAPTLAASWPPGVTPAPFEAAVDAGAVHALLQEAFEDHYAAARPGGFERWRHEMLDHPEFDPACWVLAREQQRLVGAAVALPEEGTGWIKTIGVRREARGRGIGAALLSEAIRRLRYTGLAVVELGVDADNATGATRLYERAGMRVVRRTEIYEKTITAAGCC